MFFGPNINYWRSKKQPIVFMSSIKTEYQIVAYTIVEIIWIQKLLCDLGISLSRTTKATYMAVNPVQHDHSKYIVVD